ncbi:DUF5056 domain-containing protein [Dyella flagellata]|uniref:DUF5056 domain-containing protein n=1 Tax=Dyella flagellata TaxID=1867833 RepID=A0ABQ5X9L6_9GAMM|nr:DUF5056 domain-containing protein [Dyella flagellata]GLQ87758.1 hypothetical protein GCM10007898_13260 [Dyella flagellata]
MNPSHDDSIEALLRRQFEGPVADNGFSDQVMQRLPTRRRRATWPLWVGVLTGAAACWICMASVPLLHAGWRDWRAGEPSMAAIGMWVAMLAMSLLALVWSLAESRER